MQIPREAVLLRYESDLSFKEVGVACGIDEAAARKRVSRALPPPDFGMPALIGIFRHDLDFFQHDTFVP